MGLAVTDASTPGMLPDVEEVAFSGRDNRRRLIVLLLVVTDTALAVCATVGATLLRHGGRSDVVLAGVSAHTSYLVLGIGLSFLFPFCIAAEHLYDIDSLVWGSGEFSRVVRATTLGLICLTIAAYLLKIDNLSRLWLLYVWLLASFSLSMGRWLFRIGLSRARRHNRLLRPTLLVGCSADAARIARSLGEDHLSGLSLVGCLASNDEEAAAMEFIVPGVPVIGHAGQLNEKIAATGCDAVLIVSSAFKDPTVSDIVSSLRHQPVDVHVSSGLFEVLTNHVVVREVAGTPIMLVRGTNMSTPRRIMKRAFDLVLGSATLLFGLPLWILIALAIKIDSPGPVFYHQRRIGRQGLIFGMHKFRSMYVDADRRLEHLKGFNEVDWPLFKMRNDPRVTRVGRLLRKYSLDEFPQLLNVLLGQMSMVGPRPPLPTECETYTSRHARRLEVAPGMTGLWQVSGRSDLAFEEMVRLDLFYIENWSLRFDLTLMLRTIPKVIFAQGAY